MATPDIKVFVLTSYLPAVDAVEERLRAGGLEVRTSQSCQGPLSAAGLESLHQLHLTLAHPGRTWQESSSEARRLGAAKQGVSRYWATVVGGFGALVTVLFPPLTTAPAPFLGGMKTSQKR